jgi:hypothetical protein
MALKQGCAIWDMFKCIKCAKTYDKQGLCCGKALESVCRMCGSGKDFCMCETPSTKEGLKR